MKLNVEKSALAAVCTSVGLLLAGCGGNGSDLLPDVPTSINDLPGIGGDDDNNTGEISAKYERASWPRFHVVGTGSQTFGALDTLDQLDDGAVVDIDGNVLTDSLTTTRSVREIAGDKHFAMGRWHSGAATNSSGIHQLDGKDGRALHYLVFNVLPSMPASGTFACTPSALTAPSRASGASAAYGSATGNMTLSFGADGATVNGSIDVSASSSGSLAINTIVRDRPGTVAITDNYLGSSYGAAVQIAEDSPGAYAIVGTYRALLNDGSNYIGAFRFKCS